MAMKNMLLCALMAMFWLGMSHPGVQASGVTLYVRNKEFKEQVVFDHNVLYAPVEPLLKAMKCAWVQSGDTVRVTILEGAGENLQPLTGEHLSFSYQDQTFAPPLQRKSGRLFVAVPDMAKGLHAVYQYDKDTGIADVFIPKAITPETQPQVYAPDAAPGQDECGIEILNQGITPMDLEVYAISAEGKIAGEPLKRIAGITNGPSKTLRLPAGSYSITYGSVTSYSTEKVHLNASEHWVFYTVDQPAQYSPYEGGLVQPYMKWFRRLQP